MYSLDWIEQLKLRTTTWPRANRIKQVTPAVWKLGATSFLTDISAEMVNSLLPVYLVLHLRMSPLQYGAVDAIYQGMAVALLSLAGGALADRTRRPKEVAVAGYGISAICKALLMLAGGAWTWIAAIAAADRTGKGARTAPRDALISLNSAPEVRASAFAVHRALDAGGSLLGPIIAFALLQQMPGAYDAVWLTSFVFALLGVAVLWLFVQNPPTPANPAARPYSIKEGLRLLSGKQFRGIVIAGGVLSISTMSDGFLYLLLQKKSGFGTGYFPLYYVVTASFYMLLSMPAGVLADTVGRRGVLISGYCLIGVIYFVLLSTSTLSPAAQGGVLFLFGCYYAATEGVLMAIASLVIPASLRTTGMAILATVVSLGKMVSSLAFGWLWHTGTPQIALWTFAIMLAVSIVAAALSLGPRHVEQTNAST